MYILYFESPDFAPYVAETEEGLFKIVGDAAGGIVAVERVKELLPTLTHDGDWFCFNDQGPIRAFELAYVAYRTGTVD